MSASFSPQPGVLRKKKVSIAVKESMANFLRSIIG